MLQTQPSGWPWLATLALAYCSFEDLPDNRYLDLDYFEEALCYMLPTQVLLMSFIIVSRTCRGVTLRSPMPSALMLLYSSTLLDISFRDFLGFRYHSTFSVRWVKILTSL